MCAPRSAPAGVSAGARLTQPAPVRSQTTTSVPLVVAVQAAFGQEAETNALLRAGLEGLGIENQVLRTRVEFESQLGQRAAGESVGGGWGHRVPRDSGLFRVSGFCKVQGQGCR